MQLRKPTHSMIGRLRVLVMLLLLSELQPDVTNRKRFDEQGYNKIHDNNNYWNEHRFVTTERSMTSSVFYQPAGPIVTLRFLCLSVCLSLGRLGNNL